MSDSEQATAESVAAILGLVLTKVGQDVEIPEFMVSSGLPSNSKVAVFWKDSNLVVGIRDMDWSPDEQ